MKKFTTFVVVLLSAAAGFARQEPRSCASHSGKSLEELQLHRQAATQVLETKSLGAKTAVRLLPDLGNIAHMEDADGVVARRNPFNLSGKTIRFVPSGAGFRVDVAGDSYDASSAAAGNLLSTLGDDDSRELSLPFAFPFFGGAYRSVHVNSDGNVSFTGGDVEITDRSLGRFLAGPPRIAGLFRDLDPTKARGGVRVQNEPERVVISWSEVPEYRDSGIAPLQTFQLRLFKDGRIEIAYSTAQTTDAVVGVTPGGAKGDPNLVSFATLAAGSEYTASVAERFSGAESVDIFAAAQKFYRNHDDSYDFLVVYNTLEIAADTSAVAYEVTVRNQRTGYGDVTTNIGAQAGSKKRLQAILNMGPLSQYPKDPNERVAARYSVGDTPLSILAHEAGHLFLAYASVRDQFGATPMLGYQTAHWDFRFNSDASLLEGNRIQDNGAGAAPRFTTTGTVEGFSALDQYLMGLRQAEAVPSTFFVTNARGAGSGLPRVGVAFDGDRRDVTIQEIIDAEGRRTPDHTVSQRKFRFAFLLITANGGAPTADQLAQVESYRAQFEGYFQKVTSQNATADTALRRAAHVSSFPAIGVVQGTAAPVTITLDKPATAPVTFSIRTQSGTAKGPASVTVPAGSVETRFELSGVSEGTDQLILEPADPSYETVESRVQVLPASRVKLSVLSESSPVRIKVTDINDLPYPGVSIQARVTGGALEQGSAISGADGIVEFRWTQPADTTNQLTAGLSSGPSVTITSGSKPVFAAASVLNSASYTPGIVPGGIATIFGARLGGENARIEINGEPVQVLFGNDGQLNFLAPEDLAPGLAEVTVFSGASSSAPASVPVLAVQPGLYSDASTGVGMIVVAGTTALTNEAPARSGDYLEIYATGLGAVQTTASGLRETVFRPEVLIGGAPADVTYSGLNPMFPGLYQINARVPEMALTGSQPVVVTLGGVRSNEVRVQLR